MTTPYGRDAETQGSSGYHDVTKALRRTSSTQLRLPSLDHVAGGPRQTHRSVSADRQAWLSTVQVPYARTRADKFVPLSAGMHHLVPTLDEHDEDVSQSLASPHEDYTSGPILANEGIPHRLTIITACDAFKRDEVIHTISVTMPNAALSKYPEVVHVQTPFSNDITASGDVFIFDYGVLISWALTAQQEADITALLMPCQVKALQSKDVHTETLSFLYSRDVAPNIKNDRITISTHEDGQHAAKLAISHALAQSSKLSVYEGRVAQLVERVRHLPESLALHGAVRMSHKEMSQLMGEVFIQKSEVNLLSSVLDTPDWFWSRPDALKLLYDKVCLYVELEDRVALVNSRIKLLQIILGSCADHSSHTHLTRLENIVIILIVLQVIMAGAEVVGFCLNSR